MKIIYYSYPDTSHINMTLDLSKAIVNRGHKLYYYTSEYHRNKIESIGATFLDYGIDISCTYSNDKQGEKSKYKETLVMLFNLSKHLAVKGEIIKESLLQQALKIKPDCIIFDQFCYFGKNVGLQLGIPYIASITSFVCDPELIKNGLPYYVEKYFNVNKLKRNEKKQLFEMANLFERLFSQQCNSEKTIMNYFLNTGLINLIYTCKELTPFHDKLQDTLFYTGMLKTDTQSNPVGISKKPLIYISLGTVFSDNVDFYEKCIDAFKSWDGQVIISTGNCKEMRAAHIPEHIVITKHAPQKEILRIASLFISHGGFSSIHESIVNGVPLLVIPFALDQFINSKQIEELRLGKMIKYDNITSKKILRMSKEVMSNSKVKKSCDYFKQKLSNENMMKPVLTIENLIEETRLGRR